MSLRDVAQAWMAEDPDPETRAATEAMLDDEAALQEHFGARLQFGTAGLRGVIGPGPGCMNRLLIRKVSAGLADYVLAHGEDALEAGVVIGFDGRVGSREFADETARIIAGRGLPVFLYANVVPTPELSHAVVELACAAGVMVTASHNPPEYNGYKVYWANGAQIVPPHDGGISDAIDAVTDITSEGHDIRPVPPEVRERYLARVAALRVHTDTGVRIVYTAMHGVGSELVRLVLKAAGHTDLHEVAEQAEPDGAFPTVRFPNPEEPGAMDLSLALARKVNADVVLANDPDADRLSVAVPDGDGWRQLTGNQVGVLLAADLLEHGTERRPCVATTIVSSTMLSKIADDVGAMYFETLTGFKWIATGALAAEDQGFEFVLGYEEALGYSVGPVVRDKDGVSAALLFVDLAASLKAQGITVLDQLAALYRRYGYHGSAQKSLVLPGSSGQQEIADRMAALRASPPTEIGGIAVKRVQDLLPDGDVLAYHLEDGSRVLARPSGTEPKLKFYVEVVEPMGNDDGLAEVEARCGERMAALLTSLVPE